MDEKKKDDEIEFDLGRYFGILWDRKKIAGGIIVVCSLVAMIYSLIIPPTFESTTLVQTKSSNKIDLSGSSAAMALLGMNGGSASTNDYMEMMKSRTVLEPIMDIVFEDLSEKDRDKMTAHGFAEGRLTIKNVKGTSLINVTAKGKSPEEAQMIADSVVENFLKMMTTMNQNSQSYMVKFLNERIDTTKQESEDASNKLEQYSREHKVYEPDSQTLAMLDRTAVYDKALSDFVVDQKAASAKLEAVNIELGKQNAKIETYNIAEDSVVGQLRDQIAQQEVEIVKLEQKYTEEHPELKNAREQLTALKTQLSQTVSVAVASGVATLNPTQSSLIKDQVQAQVDMDVARASEMAVRSQMAEVDDDMAQLSEDALEYFKLKRDADIKEDVYVALVKQSEQSRIQATMESMDIQVIDKANLPKEKSAPRRTLITFVGMALGLMIYLVYGFWLYRKERVV
ncbi:GumC family protein [Anaerovibrio sp. RM50]|uniref:GumC family protein n=1 Tax=Anaerovibrio sp. RM50 TaxID=1200557 RepID=UPI000489C078|nr:GumC family protein [Anaerovibrio sp. RM50]